jgi:hypothetical protein
MTIDAVPGVPTLDADIARWLRSFAAASGTVDIDALRDCFEEVFLSGDATGSRPVPREAFLSGLPQRVAASSAAGVGRAELRSASATPLDEHWVLLRTTWSAPRRSGGDLAMASTFLLHRGTDLRASLYLNHEGLPRTLGYEG